MHEGVEECDDANGLNNDFCTTQCALTYCGDGIVHVGVEECDDANALDTDACTTKCALAFCGDGILHEGVEACDDGNNLDDDACPGSCQPASCGDGYVQAGVEECDDGNADSEDGCSATCEHERKYVFVTSTLFTGDMGGLFGADASCQLLAAQAGLPGTYLAWLSTVVSSPASRFNHWAGLYVRVDGVTIAEGWSDLTDGTLDAPINLDEHGNEPPEGIPCLLEKPVWTNTAPDGTKHPGGDTCEAWTWSGVGPGHRGDWKSADTKWTSLCSGGACSLLSPIYCFEQ